GDGHVFYFANFGNKTYDGGRYTVYQSYDGGATFNVQGTPLPDSGWCRPAADHTPGSKYVYAFCTNDNGTLYSYVSADDGATFSRYTVGSYNPNDGSSSWPTIQVAKDGSVYAMYVDANSVDADGVPVTNKLRLSTPSTTARRGPNRTSRRSPAGTSTRGSPCSAPRSSGWARTTG